MTGIRQASFSLVPSATLQASQPIFALRYTVTLGDTENHEGVPPSPDEVVVLTYCPQRVTSARHFVGRGEQVVKSGCLGPTAPAGLRYVTLYVQPSIHREHWPLSLCGKTSCFGENTSPPSSLRVSKLGGVSPDPIIRYH